MQQSGSPTVKCAYLSFQHLAESKGRQTRPYSVTYCHLLIVFMANLLKKSNISSPEAPESGQLQLFERLQLVSQ